MSLPAEHKDVALMAKLCDDLWREIIKSTLFINASVEQLVRRRMVQVVMKAVIDGERDSERLRDIAYRAVDDCCGFIDPPTMLEEAGD